MVLFASDVPHILRYISILHGQSAAGGGQRAMIERPLNLPRGAP
jgi:hypothetical protein